MSMKYLGESFDIHLGGEDLVFPHHENEIAQSRAAGDDFARYWLHNAWVTLAGEKMSKSLGNFLLVTEVVKRVRPVELRYFLAAPHYRSSVEFSEESLAEAAASYSRIEGFVQRAIELVGEVDPGAVPQAFADAMSDDLGVPQGLALVHHSVREGNTALAEGEKDAVTAALADVRAMLGILGLDPLGPEWAGTRADAGLRQAVDRLVAVALEQRQAARARRDYAAADAIRDQLRAAGVLVEDTPHGPRWTLEP
jgi:cysteinyl-tRNA synthetase